MSGPFFSIVTAIKDGLSLFRKTAPTILAQTFTDWEWLIVDDGSAEPIAAYLESLHDQRIRYFRNERSFGQTPSLNRAIDESRSDWIVRMDGDDLAAPERLTAIRNAVESARAPDASGFAPLVFSDYEVIHEDGSLVATVRYNPEVPLAFYDYMERTNNPICHPTVAFYKRNPAGALYHYDERLRNAQDYALWKRIYGDYARPFRHIGMPLVRYRLVRQALSGARIREQENDLAAIRRHDAASRRSGGERVLTSAESEGMYAFRVIYYRFLGEVPSEAASPARDLAWLAVAAKYPRVMPKAAFYAAASAFGARVSRAARRRFFRGIFL